MKGRKKKLPITLLPRGNYLLGGSLCLKGKKNETSISIGFFSMGGLPEKKRKKSSAIYPRASCKI